MNPYLRTARPKQWIKNVLIFAAPAAAGVLLEPRVFVRVGLAFVAFSGLSAATYFVNDAADVESDRAHPVKRNRPVASGMISVSAAVGAGIFLNVLGLGLAWSISSDVLLTAIAYVAITTSYTFGLKHRPVVDIVSVAAGFLVRAIAGGVAAAVPLSRWFVVVVGFAALFVVAIKRASEHKASRGEADSRRVLSSYTHDYLRTVRTSALAVTLLAYALWSFERADLTSTSVPWFGLSILPVTYGLLRYELLAETIGAETPEELILSDMGLIGAGLLWAVTFGIGVVSG